MKTMIIGLSPEYNYPGSFEKWRSNNTYYASNHGASFICQALLRQFDADYIDDFSNIPSLRNKYDVCVLALSTHIHFSNFIKRYKERYKNYHAFLKTNNLVHKLNRPNDCDDDRVEISLKEDSFKETPLKEVTLKLIFNSG